MQKQVSRLNWLFLLIAVAGCAAPPPPVETADVVALRERARACQRYENMGDYLALDDAVLRLRGTDQYRCDHMQREAVHLMRDPAENPSGDPRTAQFLESVGFPNGRY